MVRFEGQFETKGQIDGHRSVLGSVPHTKDTATMVMEPFLGVHILKDWGRATV